MKTRERALASSVDEIEFSFSHKGKHSESTHVDFKIEELKYIQDVFRLNYKTRAYGTRREGKVLTQRWGLDDLERRTRRGERTS